jgi:hypothetical protein
MDWLRSALTSCGNLPTARVGHNAGKEAGSGGETAEACLV